jgi:hypothetical protein
LKRIFFLLALAMALCFAMPLAAGPIDTGPPVALAQAGIVTAYALPAVSAAPVSIPDLAIKGIDIYVHQGNPAPVLAGLLRGAAIFTCASNYADIAQAISEEYGLIVHARASEWV